jgi:hypothetical protein
LTLTAEPQKTTPHHLCQRLRRLFHDPLACCFYYTVSGEKSNSNALKHSRNRHEKAMDVIIKTKIKQGKFFRYIEEHRGYVCRVFPTGSNDQIPPSELILLYFLFPQLTCYVYTAFDFFYLIFYISVLPKTTSFRYYLAIDIIPNAVEKHNRANHQTTSLSLYPIPTYSSITVIVLTRASSFLYWDNTLPGKRC